MSKCFILKWKENTCNMLHFSSSSVKMSDFHLSHRNQNYYCIFVSKLIHEDNFSMIKSSIDNFQIAVSKRSHKVILFQFYNNNFRHNYRSFKLVLWKFCFCIWFGSCVLKPFEKNPLYRKEVGKLFTLLHQLVKMVKKLPRNACMR